MSRLQTAAAHVSDHVADDDNGGVHVDGGVDVHVSPSQRWERR
jgi:hypothetical protein